MFILVELKYKSGDSFGRVIPIFGSKLQEGGGSTKSLDKIHTFIFFNELPNTEKLILAQTIYTSTQLGIAWSNHFQTT
jgi:hypothetical protein